jgi:hypothetical protein
MSTKPFSKTVVHLLLISALSAIPVGLSAAELSVDSEACIDCHAIVTPGIVGDWRGSRHARVIPAEALTQEPRQRRISTETVPDGLADTVVGCAECHTMNAEGHPGSFEHNGFIVHTVVSPADCAGCHPVEVEEFAENLMGQAYGNLVNNPVYQMMVDSTNGMHVYEQEVMTFHGSDPVSDADSCLACHGTDVKVTGSETRDTEMGEMDFPTLSNWPNTGVGRLNPDGSSGACSSCHTRHQFSIEMARKPYTCGQCHKGPDVPAYKVYSVSVHGNIQKAMDTYWDYQAVPWTVGKDFTAPTCATCHASEVVDEQGELLAKRSHRMNDRLPWRIFGLPYAHPHPISADTTTIVNSAGLNLPTELDGTSVSEFLIDEEERAGRQTTMEAICLGCHSRQWVDGHFLRLDTSIETSNHMTLQATKIISQAWEEGLATGIPQGANPFNEAIELKWVEQWLFFGNSVRFATAMGGADYGVFADGRWTQNKNLQEMHDYLKLLRASKVPE